MRDGMRVCNRSTLTLGLCILLGNSFALVCSALSAPPSNPNLTIDVSELPYSWDKQLPSASRFAVLSSFGDAAVRDNETGLVWEKTPEATEMSWTDARTACADKDVGGRKGWRLPSIMELASLVDPSKTTGPTLPLGHPFTNVQIDVYWSATMSGDNPKSAWLVFFDTGKVLPAFKTITFHAWCVRGGTNGDQY